MIWPSASRRRASDVPALPVIDATGKLRGIFGEREFIGALFPGYLTTLGCSPAARGPRPPRSPRSCARRPSAAHRC